MSAPHTWVVSKIHALVTELTSDFVHTVKTTDSKHLEVELGGNTQEHVHVQLVVVGDEGPGGSTTGNGIKHGGLDGNEVTVIKPSSDVSVNLGTGDEDIAGLVVHDQIQVALAETLLRVLEAIEVIRNLKVESGQPDNQT
jgi:hypothetical protein